MGAGQFLGWGSGFHDGRDGQAMGWSQFVKMKGIEIHSL